MDGGRKASSERVHPIFWLFGCGAASLPFGEVEPTHVFEEASDGEHGVGADFRPAAPRPFASVSDEALAGAFHDAGSDRQSALPAEVVAHSVPVGLVGADAGRDGFGPVPVWLQGGDEPVDPPGVQLAEQDVRRFRRAKNRVENV